MPTIHVISANRFLRESLLRLFRSDKGLHVLGAAEFSVAVGEQVSRANPEIVVLSPEPDDAFFCATRAIHGAAPQAKILMIGMKDDSEVFFRAMRAGAVGYLLKDASPTQILAAAHRLARNSVVCPQHLLWELFHILADRRGLDQSHIEGPCDLTPREQQLAALLVQGLANKEIAERLNLSLGTVKSHVHSILQKTQSKNRAVLAQVVQAHSPPDEAVN
ncbi:MAG TPA: response regulator transcription factor [Candidatus Acidoferrales bacterium]|nr:response regulator transcription factor [Candidatus Acidoferrales bacterium]